MSTDAEPVPVAPPTVDVPPELALRIITLAIALADSHASPRNVRAERESIAKLVETARPLRGGAPRLAMPEAVAVLQRALGDACVVIESLCGSTVALEANAPRVPEWCRLAKEPSP